MPTYSKQDLRDHISRRTERAQSLKQALTFWSSVGVRPKCIMSINRSCLSLVNFFLLADPLATSRENSLKSKTPSLTCGPAKPSLASPCHNHCSGKPVLLFSEPSSFREPVENSESRAASLGSNGWLIRLVKPKLLRNDYAEVYRIMNRVAPKKRREQVRIKGQQNRALDEAAGV